MENSKDFFSVNIRRLREKADLTQSELAEKAGLSLITIQNYEYGKRAGNPKTLQRISSALGVSVAILLTDPNSTTPSPMTRGKTFGDMTPEEFEVWNTQRITRQNEMIHSKEGALGSKKFQHGKNAVQKDLEDLNQREAKIHDFNTAWFNSLSVEEQEDLMTLRETESLFKLLRAFKKASPAQKEAMILALTPIADSLFSNFETAALKRRG